MCFQRIYIHDCLNSSLLIPYNGISNSLIMRPLIHSWDHGNLLPLDLFSFNEKPPYTSCGLLMVCVGILHLHIPKLHFYTLWYSAEVTVGLELNSDHITYCTIYHMDPTWSVGLAWTCFDHSDYLVTQGWICITCLFLDTVNKTGPNVYHLIKSVPMVTLLVFHRKDLCEARLNSKVSSLFQMKCTLR